MKRRRPPIDPDKEPELWGSKVSWQAKEEGIKQVRKNTQARWRASVYRLARAQPKEIPVPFKAEDFIRYAEPLIGKPHIGQAWAGIWNWLIRFGDVEDCAAWKPAEKRSNHARKSFLYRWPLRNGDRDGIEVKME